MSSIKKQPNGRWKARYRDANGRSRSQTFDRKTDAQRFLDDASTDTRRGEFIDPRSRRQTFDEWSERWWETTVRLQPSTRRGYWTKLEGQVRPYFGGRRLADIDYMDLESFIAHLHKAGLSVKTIRECVTIVSLIMHCAVKAQVRRDNPAASHSLQPRRRKIGTGDVLDMDQALRLVEHVPEGRWRTAVWLLLLTGMRPSELCGLRVRSIDFTRRTCRVSATLQPVQRFGADEHRWRLVEGPPKTEAGDRTIPLPAWLCEDLAAMLAERKGNGGEAPARGEFLFVTKYGNPINLNKMRERVIRPALKAAALPETLRTYDLRHSHASLLIDLGANPLAVAQRLGHSDPAMTLRVYGHLFEGVQEQLTEQLDGLRAVAATSADKDVVVPLRGHA